MVDKRKILIVTDAWHPQINGVVRTYEHLRDELTAVGHDVRVIGPADFPFTVPLPGYSEIRLALFPYRRLAQTIAAYAPTSIHIATEGPLGRAARKYCLKNNILFTTAYHTEFPAYVVRRVERFLPFLKEQCYRLADNMIRRFHAPAAGVIVTTATLEHGLRERGYKMPLFQMIRGVPVDVFKPGPATLFQSLARPVALYVGRVAVEKNLEAFLDMRWEGSKVVVGDGPDLPRFRKSHRDVVFAGVKTGQDLADHYRSADIFVFPSRTDTFGIVLLEALACGLPVAAYNVTGPRDIITAPYLGLLHDHDLTEAAQRALALKDEKDKRHEYVSAHYSWKTAAGEFLKILDICEKR